MHPIGILDLTGEVKTPSWPEESLAGDGRQGHRGPDSVGWHLLQLLRPQEFSEEGEVGYQPRNGGRTRPP